MRLFARRPAPVSPEQAHYAAAHAIAEQLAQIPYDQQHAYGAPLTLWGSPANFHVDLDGRGIDSTCTAALPRDFDRRTNDSLKATLLLHMHAQAITDAVSRWDADAPARAAAETERQRRQDARAQAQRQAEAEERAELERQVREQAR